jgi:pyruvate dehydrogenase E1 component alpha subunit
MQEWTIEKLKKYEEKIASIFNAGEIRAPVHLSDGNELELLSIFKEIREQDWVFCSWRSHYQCLLKGVSPEDLEFAIRDGRSIALSFPDHNIYSSAIVGGQISLAVGAALAAKRKGSNAHIWCFIGDMTSETGVAQSAFRYSIAFDLPITFVIEDNGISVLTETRKVWNVDQLRYEENSSPKIRSFKYKSRYPHAGAGVRVQF